MISPMPVRRLALDSTPLNHSPNRVSRPNRRGQSTSAVAEENDSSDSDIDNASATTAGSGRRQQRSAFTAATDEEAYVSPPSACGKRRRTDSRRPREAAEASLRECSGPGNSSRLQRRHRKV